MTRYYGLHYHLVAPCTASVAAVQIKKCGNRLLLDSPASRLLDDARSLVLLEHSSPICLIAERQRNLETPQATTNINLILGIDP